MKGDPDPQVTWTKDGAPISSSEIMEVKYKNGTASVLINEVFPEDAGTSEDEMKRLVYGYSNRFNMTIKSIDICTVLVVL